MYQDTTLYGGRVLAQVTLCWMGTHLPVPRKGALQPTHHFLAHIYCGKMAGWIRVPLGTEVSLGPGDIVLDGDPAPHPMEWGTAATPPIFGPFLLWQNGWMD